jgi:hypothetical protein
MTDPRSGLPSVLCPLSSDLEGMRGRRRELFADDSHQIHRRQTARSVLCPLPSVL